jgi:hypothetical protein
MRYVPAAFPFDRFSSHLLQDAVAAAYEVFDLGSKSIDKNGIQLRRSVRHIDSKTNVWAKILPREWTVVVRSNIDEVAVFMKEDEDKSMRDGAGEKVTPTSLRLAPYSKTVR